MRARKTDDNQKRLVECLRAAGVEVRVLSAVGSGMTDLLTYYRGVIRVVEIKNLDGRGRKLTKLQEKFRKTWPVIVVADEREALAAHGIEVDDACA